jgi:hypothetical protein
VPFHQVSRAPLASNSLKKVGENVRTQESAKALFGDSVRVVPGTGPCQS